MTFSVMWTVLPGGYAGSGTGTLQLRLVATPRVTDARLQLGQSPLLNWPGFAAALPALFVQTRGTSDLIPASRVGPAPEPDLWQRMFSPTTKVQTRGLADRPPQIVASTASFVRAEQSLRALRRAAVADRTIDPAGRVTGGRRALDVVRAISALAAPAADRRVAEESLDEQVARFRVAGDENAALAAPFAAYAQALGGRPAARANRAGRPLTGVPLVTAADFHQVIGLLLSFPHLARAVGLIIDLTVPAFTGTRSIRVVTGGGQPVQGDKPVPQPFSRVVATPDRRRFVMADGPGPAPEVAGGMLAVAGNPDYVVASTDVVGTALQLVAQSDALAGRVGDSDADTDADSAAGSDDEGADHDPEVDDSLPARRDLGITIARRNRPSTVVTPSLQRSAQLHQQFGAADPTGQDLELFADDVTRGFRLDVARGGGPFRSLMTRQVSTTVGGRILPPAVDEGRVEAFTGVEQSDVDGVAQLTTGEEVASWDGWSIAVPRPGFKVETEPGAPAHAAPVPPTTLPGYGIRTEISAVPGTVERLRFGDRLTFRARAVDLAGGSIDPVAADPAQVLPPFQMRRGQPAASPTLVLRRRYTAGESLLHLVVRSSGGVPDGPPCERHLAPPNAPFALAERHGVFDAALGNNRGNQGIRDEMLTLARREEGSFLDPMVPDRDGVPTPAAGIAVVNNNPAAPPVGLPVPRGQALPNGAYVIHDTDRVRLPYLADPIAGGVSLIGFPGTQGPVVAPFGGPGWPDVQPIRLIVRPTSRTRPDAGAEVVDDAGRPALVVHVPPGFTETVELSSSIRADLLGQLDTAGANTKTVTTGLLPELSPRQRITIVHAVPVPSAAPAVAGPVTPTQTPGAPSYTATVPVTVHRPTTAQVDVEATWREVADPGVGDLVDADRVLRVGSAVVERGGQDPVQVPVRHLFGDTRHRRITLTPWATTRFREYFTPVPDGDRSRQRPAAAGVPVSIKNRTRPGPPVVHSVLPLFGWSRGIDEFGRRFGSRKPAGLRVYLARPWLTTGADELLGVVIHTSTPPTGSALTRLDALVSKWGGDALERQTPLAPDVIVKSDFAASSVIAPADLVLTDPRAGGASAQIIGHRVHFDPDRDLWYADVRLSVTDEPWPFVRLGLVRYQPESVPGSAISPVVTTDFAQLPPDRTATFVRENGGIRVRVTGKPTKNSVFTIRQERYLPDPFDPAGGLASDVGVGPAEGWTVTHGTPTGAVLATMLLRFTGPGTPPGPVSAELAAGRVVVEESNAGLALLQPGAAERVVFTEAVARADIPEA